MEKNNECTNVHLKLFMELVSESYYNYNVLCNDCFVLKGQSNEKLNFDG